MGASERGGTFLLSCVDTIGQVVYRVVGGGGGGRFTNLLQALCVALPQSSHTSAHTHAAAAAAADSVR